MGRHGHLIIDEDSFQVERQLTLITCYDDGSPKDYRIFKEPYPEWVLELLDTPKPRFHEGFYVRMDEQVITSIKAVAAAQMVIVDEMVLFEPEKERDNGYLQPARKIGAKTPRGLHSSRPPKHHPGNRKGKGYR